LKGLKTRLISASIAKNDETTSSDLNCLKFFYFIRGDESVKLNVLVKGASGAINATEWSRFKDYGDQWNQAELTIKSTDSYQTIFEADASAATQWLGTIAIDDVLTVRGACQPSGFCNFDKTLQACVWYNIEGRQNTNVLKLTLNVGRSK
jgi:hypothetical protein